MVKTIAGAAMLAAIGLAVTEAQAQSIYMVQIVDEGIFLADQSSIRRVNGRPQIDLHFVYTTPLGFERNAGAGYEWIQRNVSRMEYDCQGRRAREISMAFYDFSGRKVEDLRDVGDWETFGAESPNALTMGLACNNTPPSDAKLESLDQAIFVFYDVMNNPED